MTLSDISWKLRRKYWRYVRGPIHRRWVALRDFRQRKNHPTDRWFYHLPTYVRKEHYGGEDYYWISAWSCGCCVKRIGLCTLHKIDPADAEGKAYIEGDGTVERDKLSVYYEIDGQHYALTFHHDNPPFGLKETEYGYIDVDAFKRLDAFPREDDLIMAECMLTDKIYRRTYENP